MQNINLKIPEEGEKIKRLVELAKERNIDYKPSVEASHALNEYCERKGFPNPMYGNGKKPDLAPMQLPQYNPMPPPSNLPPPSNFPPPMMPPHHGDGFGGPGIGINVTQSQSQMPMTH